MNSIRNVSFYSRPILKSLLLIATVFVFTLVANLSVIHDAHAQCPDCLHGVKELTLKMTYRTTGADPNERIRVREGSSSGTVIFDSWTDSNPDPGLDVGDTFSFQISSPGSNIYVTLEGSNHPTEFVKAVYTTDCSLEVGDEDGNTYPSYIKFRVDAIITDAEADPNICTAPPPPPCDCVDGMANITLKLDYRTSGGDPNERIRVRDADTLEVLFDSYNDGNPNPGISVGSQFSFDVSNPGNTIWVTVQGNNHSSETVKASFSTNCNLDINDTSGNSYIRFKVKGIVTDAEDDPSICEPETGSITIKKITNPTDSTKTFSFEGDLDVSDLGHNETDTTNDLLAGDYNVTELVPAGWELDSVVCVGGDSTQITDGVTIHLDPAEDITCTFTNSKLPPNECPTNIDFEGYAAGTIVSNQFPGVVITTNDPDDHPLMIFDTANVTGGDNDLGAPNSTFGGPGQGSGGEAGNPGENSQSLGKVLIISQDGSTTNPNDSSGGGTITFTFTDPADVTSISILDVDDDEVAGTVKAYDSSNNLLKTVDIVGLGNNSYQELPIMTSGVKKLEVFLPSSGAIPGLTFCETPPEVYNLGDFIWNDTNENGVQDDGEQGIEGVELELYVDGETFVVDTDTTDANGEYLFPNLPDGDYIVKIVDSNFDPGGALNGYSYSPKDASVNDAEDSDFDSGTGEAPGTIAGADNLTVDGGFYIPELASLGDFVWEDLDLDGIQDDGEPGIEFVTVTLTGGGPDGVIGTGGDDTTEATQTNSDGFYEFTGLNPGEEYKVTFGEPSGYKFTKQNEGSNDAVDSDADPSNGMSQIVTLGSGEHNPTLDAGLVQLASLGDYVWEDLDGDGIQDGNEPGVENVTVTLTGGGPDGVIGTGSDDTTDTTTTDSDGLYGFDGLNPGEEYKVTFTLPNGYEFTKQNQGSNDAVDSDADPSNGMSQVVTLDPGEDNPTLDAGLVQTASLGDYVWEDLDGDGIQDGNEPGVEDVTVTLTGGGPDGVIGTGGDDTTDTTTTDSDGLYGFDNLNPGEEYKVTFTLPNGYEFTKQNQGSNDAVDSDADPSNGMSQVVTLDSGENNLTLDAGLIQPASLGDYVWEDLDLDGIQDGDEPGVENVTVTLTGGGPDGVIGTGGDDTTDTTTTDSDGLYGFDDLNPGEEYKVTFEEPTGYSFTEQNAGSNDAVDSDADPSNGMSQVVTLDSGENNPTLDAGLIQPASLGDYVWEDLDADGIQDGNEPGVENVTVTLTGGGPDGVIGTGGDDTTDTTTTDSDGLYGFDDLNPGEEYKVTFTLPSGYDFTEQNAGSDDAVDSDADPSNGMSQVVTLDSGENNPTLDAGLIQTASLGDYVWEDLDADGIQDGNEPGVEGVTVTLTGGGPDGVIGTGGDDTTDTTTTDSDGLYGFDGLNPGEEYKVTFEAPDGYDFTLQNQGSNDAVDSDADPSNGMSQVVTLESGENNPTLDAGLIQPASLGDYVWEDLDADGIQDGNEPGVEGVTVTLTGGGPDGVIGTGGDDTTDTTTTDSDGLYGFDELNPSEEYKVTFTLPSGYDFTEQNAGSNDAVDSDADPSNGMSQVVTLESGENNPTLDAGLIQPASLGDYVWEDLDADGIQDNDEPGVEGVTVTLTGGGPDGVIGTGGDDTTDTTTTDSDGFYEFTDLNPGEEYKVTFEEPSGYSFTEQNAGSNDAVDSDADPSNGMSQVVTLESGENNPTIDAGLVQPASLGDTVWEDLDADGIQDGDEPGVEDVTVTLTGGGPDGVIGTGGDDTTDTTTTDSDGFYEFTDLNPGEEYKVTFEAPSGYSFTEQNAGSNDAVDSDADPSNGMSQVVTLESGENDPTIDAGLIQTASLGDYVWEDLDADGIQDGNEPGVEGVTVTLTGGGPDGVIGTGGDDTTDTTTTDSDGLYGFDDLNPGEEYKVTFTLPSGYDFTKQNEGSNDAVDSDADPSNGMSQVVTLESGENNPTIDAGLIQTASLGDYVWEDLDADGIQDGNEPGVEGVTVTLTGGGPDGVIGTGGDDTTDTTTTDSDGLYGFDDLNPGEEYKVTFTLPSGYDFTKQNEGSNDAVDSDADPSNGMSQVVTLESGENNPTIDAGLIQPASLGDTVWEDLDADGIQDGDEPGVEGVTVTLTGGGPDGVIGTGGDDTTDTTTTDSDGFYEFTDLNPGEEYKVTFEEPSGYSFTEQNAGSNDAVDSDADPSNGMSQVVTLESGENDDTIDAGLVQPASLGDYVWEDLNGNGIQDGDEPGVEGVTVTLTGGGPDGVIGTGGDDTTDTTTTDSDGFYEFTDLNPGEEYKVTFEEPDGYDFTKQDEGSNDAVDSDADPSNGMSQVVTLESGENNPTIDAGLIQSASLGDYVWEDLDADGIQDGDEPGVEGVTVTLTGGGPDGVIGTGGDDTTDTTTTDSDGFYEFTDLNPGEEYKVTFDEPDGYDFTKQDEGSNDAVDSDADPSNGMSQVVTLESGENNPTIDAGLVPLGTITIVKDADPADDTGFDFTSAIPVTGADSFTLQDPSDASITFNDVAAGSYLAQEDLSGFNGVWVADGVSCVSSEGDDDESVEGSSSVLIDLDPGETITCTFSNSKLAPGIDIEKATNGEDADSPTGPVLGVGETATFTYVVDNTGELPLSNVVVTDDNGTPSNTGDDFNPTYVSGDDNTNNILDVDETWTYQATATVVAGQYTNMGSVTADDPEDNPVDDEDPSNHFGADPAIDIEKATNGEDADSPTGPRIGVGGTATFTYDVTNTGNVPLDNVVVTDDNGTPSDTGDDFAPAPVLDAGFNVGDTNDNGILDVGEVWQYTASTTVVEGQYTNIGSVTADDPEDNPVDDKDPSNHFGTDVAIDIEKATNGEDADTPTGPVIGVGNDATFTYDVENTGNVALDNVVVTDDNGTPGDTGDDFNPDPVLDGGFNVGDVNENGILDVGEVWKYTATTVVVEGQYTNIGTVTADDPDDNPVDDEDPSNHFGSEPAIDIEKATNGEDADSPTGPIIGVGDTATFTYDVTNIGNVPLDNVIVTDDNGTPGSNGDDFNPTPVLDGGFNIGDTNDDGNLDVGEVWKYTASTTVVAGQYTNIGSVTATDPADTVVLDEDPSNHFGADPGIDIEKATNGEDADTPTGPVLDAGDTATFTYVVRNTGNVALDNVVVTDDNGTPGGTGDDFNPTYVSGDDNNNDILEVDEVWEYTASATVVAGQYTNIGSVTADDPNDDPVDDEDPSNHFGAAPAIDIEKATNGEDADTPTGPVISVGGTATFTYDVTNIGNVALDNVVVTDDNGTPGDTGDDFAPAPVLDGGFNVGDTNDDGILDVGEVWKYTASTTVVSGQYTNIGSVTADDPDDNQVDDSDPSNHFGADAGIDIEKATNGEDADSPTGPVIAVGDTATFTYDVTNTGNVALDNVVVTDDNGTPGDDSDDFNPTFVGGDTNNDGKLDVSETWQYEASATVVAGQYTNIGSVTAEDPDDNPVDDEDPSNHFGADPSIDIEKATNGEDADTPTGPIISVGGTAIFTYDVTNTGNVPLSNVVVTDDAGTPDDDSDDFNPLYAAGDDNNNDILDVGEVWMYTASTTVVAGQYTNIGDVTADDPDDNPVDDSDPSNHFGADPSIDIEKATNGEDADSPTGPVIGVGETATFTYEVRNTGNVALDDVVVTDDNGTPGNTSDDFNPTFTGGDTNNDGKLDLDETWTYEATATVVAGQYTNIGSVTADDPNDNPVDDEDPSNHFGADAAIVIEKATNGEDADSPTGPYISVGDTAMFTYEVRNTGNVPLDNVVVTDDNGTPGNTSDDFNPTFVGGDDNNNDILEVDEVWEYTASATVVAGQYTNIGSVTADDPDDNPVDDEDPSNHFGADPDIDIEKATNGQDADTPTGPIIIVGGTATFTYDVTNTGNVPLDNVVVTDDNGTPGNTSDDFNPTFVGGDTNNNGKLDLTETWKYEASAVVVEGQYTNIGKVRGDDPTGERVRDDDPSNHYGEAGDPGSITIIKVTNPAGKKDFGFDGDLGSFVLDDGQSFTKGDLAAGTYNVYEIKSTFPDKFWALLYVMCEAEGTGLFFPTVTQTDDTYGVDIPLAEGQDVTCTFHNERVNLDEGDDKGNKLYLPIITN